MSIWIFEFGESRYQPELRRIPQDRAHYEIDQRWLALVVGYIGVFLPITLAGISLVTNTCYLDSISHFYYAKILGDGLVGSLVFIGAFLIAYRGETKAENVLATIAGLATFGVAIFPTSGNGCDEMAFASRVFTDNSGLAVEGGFYDLFPYVGHVHYACAAVLFGFLAYYSLFVFTRVDQTKPQRINGVMAYRKAWRNRIYIVSGYVIVGSGILMLVSLTCVFEPWWDKYNGTFVSEAVSLVAFGVSWLVKGRFRFFGLVPDLEDTRQA